MTSLKSYVILVMVCLALGPMRKGAQGYSGHVISVHASSVFLGVWSSQALMLYCFSILQTSSL